MNRRKAMGCIAAGCACLGWPLAPALARAGASRFTTPDGLDLHFVDEGSGLPVVLVHGFTADAEIAWRSTGMIEALVNGGRRVIAPDWRGHGKSGAPEDPAAYPPDCVPADHEALIAHLDLGEFDLVGYSYGGQVVARLLARGLRPRRAIVGGIGATGITDVSARREYFESGVRGTDPSRGRPLREFMARTGMTEAAALGVLSSLVSTTREELAAVPTPVLVLCGEEDSDFGSAEELASLFANGRVLRIPGTHMSTPWTSRFVPEVLAYLS